MSAAVTSRTENEVAVAAGVPHFGLQNLSYAVKWFFWSIEFVVIVMEELVQDQKLVGGTHKRSEVQGVLIVALIGSLVKKADNFIWGVDDWLGRYEA